QGVPRQGSLAEYGHVEGAHPGGWHRVRHVRVTAGARGSVIRVGAKERVSNMKPRLIAATAAGCAFMLAWFAPVAVSLAAGQRGGTEAAPAAPAESTSSGPIPRMADGHPDLSGVWWRGADIGAARGRAGRGGARGGARGTPPPTFASLYRPEAAAKAKTLSDKDDPTLRCIPTAFGTLNISLFDVGAVAQILC